MPVHAFLHTPCDRAPANITLSLVASPGGFGPFYFTMAVLQRGPGRASSCPLGPPPPLPYRFGTFLNETCPMGPVAQHGMPCPWEPCIAPAGKNGTCLNTPDLSVPAKTGSLMAEARVELLTDEVNSIRVLR